MSTTQPNPRDVPEVPVREENLSPPSGDAYSRRTALKLFSATAMLAFGAGCTRKPERHVVSLTDAPEYQKPGIPLHYASTWTDGEWPYGLMVKAVDGRPVKVEGLPGHPLNQGRSNGQMQASLLSLYDPERMRAPQVGGEDATWEEADAKVVAALQRADAVAVFTRALLGPSERALVKRFCQVVPNAEHVVWEPCRDADRRIVWEGVYGQAGIPLPDLSKASVILSVDCDFLGTDGETVGQTREFAARRVVAGDDESQGLSRLYVAESAMSTTGSNADHRFPIPPSATLAFLDAVAAAVGGEAEGLAKLAEAHDLDETVLAALAKDIGEHQGEVVVLAGRHLAQPVHAAVALRNEEWGAGGGTLRWVPDPPALPAQDVPAFSEGERKVALFLGVNPLHDDPSRAESFASIGTSVGHGLTRNESLAACAVALPSAHNLESWNDAAPLPGVQTLCQPMIAPLFDGRQEAESLLRWAQAVAPNDPAWKDVADWHDFVKRRWQTDVLSSAGDPEEAWEEALRTGLTGEVEAPALPPVDRTLANVLVERGGPVLEGGVGASDRYELVLLPHPTVFDGRFAGNAWLQELPDPVSRLVWDNAAQLAPQTAEALGVEEGDWVTLKVGGQSLDLPVIVQTGTAPGVVALTLGHGRKEGAGVGNGVGVNAAPFLGLGRTRYWAHGARLEKAARKAHELVRTQQTFGQMDRPLALSGTADEYREHPDFVKHRAHVPPLDKQLHGEFDYSKGNKWEMAVDLSACTGCGACTVACQAENNVPAVGKEECGLGREMSWIRIDRYESGDPANPEVVQQPMLCQHCDNAPCENVCPVNATAHGPEGLNQQVYNRCVGTRYCANNCPYKVRRFNYYAYTKNSLEEPVQDLMYNPQVTVRMRGIMEKCTFCVQRINAAKFARANAGEDVQDGDIVPACQQACPASALVFGNRNDEQAQVAKQKASPLGYRVLEELNVRPGITYLAKVRNPAVVPDGHFDHDAHDAHDAEKGGHR